MILPIVAYGSPVLRKIATDITAEYPGLSKLLDDMWETMYNSNGVGLAAPQINKDIRLFVMDSEQIFDNQDDDEKGIYPDEPGFKGVFINAHIVELNGDKWTYNEGCLSIPKVREDVMRHQSVTIDYVDENFSFIENIVIGFDGILTNSSNNVSSSVIFNTIDNNNIYYGHEYSQVSFPSNFSEF